MPFVLAFEDLPSRKQLACFSHHDRDDVLFGQPICPDCYRYEEHIVFHGLVPELWRRTTIYTFRALARLLETTPSKLREKVQLSFVKVVEYQARGAVHLHVVVRADGSGEGIVPPPPEVSAQVLGAPIILGRVGSRSRTRFAWTASSTTPVGAHSSR